MTDIIVKPVNQDNWADFETLFQSKGAPSYCWCAAWRMNGKESEAADSSMKREFMRRRVLSGIPIGLLAYSEGAPVAWCSVAPRETYRKLGGDAALKNVWSIACFFIKKDFRGEGFVSRLIDEAKTYARENGAAYLEAFPVDPESPSYRHMGFVKTFDKAGFVRTHMVGTRRHAMIYKL
jgi:GNAT superfamily N-acetyltransferase